MLHVSAASQRLRAEYLQQHGTEPFLWFDKCCIDLNNIGYSLVCLPVFVASCKKMAIIIGPTFLFRLLCVVEIYVFISMGGRTEHIELFLVSHEPGAALDGGVCAGSPEHTLVNSPMSDTSHSQAIQHFAGAIQKFDVRDTQCFNSDQREHLLAIIEAGFGSMDAFNTVFRDVMHQLRLRALSSEAYRII